MQEIIETLVNWTTDLEFWYDIGIALAIFLGFVIFRKIFTKYIFKIITRFTSKTKAQIFHKVLLAFERPLRAFFIFLGLYIAYVSLEFSGDFITIPRQFFRTAIIVLITWGLINLSSTTSVLFEQIHRRLNIQVDAILIPFLSKVLKFIIVAISLSVIAQEWGYDVNGFVAGLGIGGLAIAFAAKESLGNLLGGVVIIIERPFSIGDWIQTPSVEGVVEDINFRSTQVRTFADSLVTVPNATISNEAITNWSRMRKRRITFNLGLTYNTPRNKIKTCVERIRTMIREHEGVHPEFIVVNFDRYNSSSLDLLIYFFTITTSWEKYLTIKEEINLKILEILEEENVDVAFPSTSVYMETQSESYEKSDLSERTTIEHNDEAQDRHHDNNDDDQTGQPEGERG
ncbi:mechanosensitive ion channel family protein [Alkalihalobacillus sp. AL-G]|uniref:mechanosensitive ion channel family protein n=1 Tax=Alkalihalobacillus sp. AL-G TaxID=2926399 RepID=UPI002729B2E3|nr:mechanosensitive ion channel family protein [Alkalihalobacillus sp. AL-G]WLD93250.1 mechanosensitive ion channel family protein [Alkalihalobacillus sp. AL-G]